MRPDPTSRAGAASLLLIPMPLGITFTGPLNPRRTVDAVEAPALQARLPVNPVSRERRQRDSRGRRKQKGKEAQRGAGCLAAASAAAGLGGEPAVQISLQGSPVASERRQRDAEESGWWAAVCGTGREDIDWAVSVAGANAPQAGEPSTPTCSAAAVQGVPTFSCAGTPQNWEHTSVVDGRNVMARNTFNDDEGCLGSSLGACLRATPPASGQHSRQQRASTAGQQQLAAAHSGCTHVPPPWGGRVPQHKRVP